MNRDKMKIDPAILEFCEESNAAVVKAWSERFGCSEEAARVLAEAWAEWQRPLIDAAWYGRAEWQIDIDVLRKTTGRKIDEVLTKVKTSTGVIHFRMTTPESPMPIYLRTYLPDEPIQLKIRKDGSIFIGEGMGNCPVLPPYTIDIGFVRAASRLEPKTELSPISANKVQSLKFGPHLLYWRIGGVSLALVGGLHDGRRWFAPANWTSKEPDGIASSDWSLIHDAAEYGAWSTVPVSE